MMSPETVFKICNSLALVGWLLLDFAPRWRWTGRLVLSNALPLLLACVYVTLIAATFGKAEGGFSTLADVMKLFRNDWVALTGWVHYLVFDLFVGGWIVLDAQARGIKHLLIVPCLILTFLLGPAGLLVYYLVKLLTRRTEVAT